MRHETYDPSTGRPDGDWADRIHPCLCGNVADPCRDPECTDERPRYEILCGGNCAGHSAAECACVQRLRALQQAANGTVDPAIVA